MTTPAKYPTRQFLMLAPRPARVKLTLTNAEVRTLDVPPAPSWKRLAETIDALAPVTIEALDAAGNLLRARNPEQAAILEEEGEDLEDPDDPITDAVGDGQLETFARLLADAHRQGSERSLAFVETAFREMVNIVNAHTKRMDSMERVVDGMHRVWRRAFEAQIEQSGEDDSQPTMASTLQQMLGSFMAAQAQGAIANAVAAPAKPNVATNGTHTKGAP